MRGTAVPRDPALRTTSARRHIRAFDLAVTIAVLPFALVVGAVIAVIIFVDSPGPIFYRSTRVGHGGERFQMLKFRKMRRDATGAPLTTFRDERLTPIGEFLVATKLDELPQLWNVLRGDMTLVGPRPPVWREVALYDTRALRRLEVRPGLTCLWQVGGRSDLSFAQQVELDLEYIDRVRPLDELLIVARTIPAVLTGRGAY